MNRTMKAWTCALFFAVCACGGTGNVCPPGETDYCPCPGATLPGTQNCNYDGSAWSECACGGGNSSSSGIGGASVSTSSSSGMGGAAASSSSSSSGMGGAGGGDAGACAPTVTCISQPVGQCAPLDNGCGVKLNCKSLCDSGPLYCDPNTWTCLCSDGSNWADGILACKAIGTGTPMFCGDSANPNIPAGCVSTGKIGGNGHVIWCCS